jgi:hypothetical protein
MGMKTGITGDPFQPIQNVIPPHLLQPPEQINGVIEHDARIAALIHQIGDKLSHATIAPGKNTGVVVISLLPMLKHILQIADQLTLRSGWDGGLVHV